MSGKMHIKRGDMVYVLAGKSYLHRLEDAPREELANLQPQDLKKAAEKRAGRRGKVLRVLREQGRVVVEGVNMVTKHARAKGQTSRAAQMQTGRIQQPAPISLANVMLICPRCDAPTKVTYRGVESKRVRVCRRCHEYVDEV